MYDAYKQFKTAQYARYLTDKPIAHCAGVAFGIIIPFSKIDLPTLGLEFCQQAQITRRLVWAHRMNPPPSFLIQRDVRSEPTFEFFSSPDSDFMRDHVLNLSTARILTPNVFDDL